MASLRRQLRDVGRALDAALTPAQWQAAAEEFDRLTGAWAWREEAECVFYDAELLKRAMRRMEEERGAGDAGRLAQTVSDALYRHRDDIAAPELYQQALSGTKHLVTDFLDEIEASLRWLMTHPVPGWTEADRIRRLRAGLKVYGRSALMLSGGATLGFHHLGVVKALFEAGLLPHILSGASTGAMVAAGVCARSDEDLAEMFADTEQIRLDGLVPVGIRRALANGGLLDPEQLYAVLRHNVGGDITFAEAFARSGRALNISVSPTRHRQKPRLLCHLTTPRVLIARAALASSALPGFFPPVSLESRDRSGQIVQYIPSERWVDGSIAEDLPKLRLARLHNVNHFIVSQTNPHVLPFVRHHGQRGLRASVAGLTAATARTQGAFAVDVARRLSRPSRGPLGQVASQAHSLVSQEYRGDIDIHPHIDLRTLSKVMTNPSREELAEYILGGERATWPKLPMIRDQTRVSRLLREGIGWLEQESRGASPESR